MEPSQIAKSLQGMMDKIPMSPKDDPTLDFGSDIDIPVGNQGPFILESLSD
jgi:hypothetical protein